MQNLIDFPNRLESETLQCRAIIETPKGRRSKFRYDPESNLFSLSALLPEGMVFPYDFGFIPSTIGEDGDPLDLMLLMDEPAHVGCLVDVRLIGALEAEQTEDGKTEDNHRLLAVAVKSPAHGGIRSIDELSKSLLDQIAHFFVSYNEMRGRKFRVKGQGGPERALAILEQGIQAFHKERG